MSCIPHERERGSVGSPGWRSRQVLRGAVHATMEQAAVPRLISLPAFGRSPVLENAFPVKCIRESGKKAAAAQAFVVQRQTALPTSRHIGTRGNMSTADQPNVFETAAIE